MNTKIIIIAVASSLLFFGVCLSLSNVSHGAEISTSTTTATSATPAPETQKHDTSTTPSVPAASGSSSATPGIRIDKTDSSSIVYGESLSESVARQKHVPVAAAPVSHPRRTRPCHIALSVCQRSCSERGGMYSFGCVAPDFQPYQNHEICHCADEVR